MASHVDPWCGRPRLLIGRSRVVGRAASRIDVIRATAAGCSKDQTRFEHDVALAICALDAEKNLNCGGGNLFDGLAYHRERGCRVLGLLRSIESQQRDVSRHSQARFMAGTKRADALQVGTGENCGRPFRQ